RVAAEINALRLQRHAVARRNQLTQPGGSRGSVGERSNGVALRDEVVDVGLDTIEHRDRDLTLPAVVSVVEVQHLILVELIEGHVRRRLEFAVRILLAGERQAAVLRALVVEEDDSRPATACVAEWFSL